MPSGAFHAGCSLAGGIIGGTGAYYVTRDIEASLAFGMGCGAIGLLITPDLDVRGSPTHASTEAKRGVSNAAAMVMGRKGGWATMIGMIAGFMWWVFWIPYSLMVPGHRSTLSHFPLISTAGRAGYLGVITLPIFWLIQKAVPVLSYLPIPGWKTWIIFAAMFIALVLASVLKLDLTTKQEKSLFWSGICVLIIGAVLYLGATKVWGFLPIPAISLEGWLFAGLCCSDTMHTLADWYMPKWISRSILC